MRFANNAIVSRKPGPFAVPVLSAPGDPFNIANNKTLNEYYFGSGEDASARLLNVTLEIMSLTLNQTT